MTDANCDEPICEKADPITGSKKYRQKGKRISFDDADDGSSYSSNDQNNQKDPNSNLPKEYFDCPNTRESVGYFTWNFIHTMAIYYPEKPSEDQKSKMRNFIDALGEFYPCKSCSAHFKYEVKQFPPKVESNKDLSIWFCERHNSVNTMNEKPMFDCSWENLLKRYKTGYPGCKK